MLGLVPARQTATRVGTGIYEVLSAIRSADSACVRVPSDLPGGAMDGMLQGVYLPLRKTENIADDLSESNDPSYRPDGACLCGSLVCYL